MGGGRKTCESSGAVDAPLLIVGMAPGKSELVEGRPFVGTSGRILQSALRSVGMSLSGCRLVNVVNCYPTGPGETLTKEQIEGCKQRFRADLLASSPRAILAMGSEALEAVTGLGGPKNGISAWQGYILKAGTLPLHVPPSTHAVVPAYHPAFVVRSGLKPYPWMRAAVRKAVGIARGTLREETVPAKNSPFPEAPPPVVAFDIETHGDLIVQIGLAWSSRSGEQATSLRWTPSAVETTRRALSSTATKLVFNGNFDIPRLRKAGVEVRAPIFDLLWAAQLIDPDAPGYSLNEVAAFYLNIERWKHKGNPGSRGLKAQSMEEYRAREKEEEHYNRTDAFVLLPLYAIFKGELERTGMAPLFDRTMRCLPTLIDMYERGLRIDPVARDEMKAWYTKRQKWAEERWARETGGLKPRSPKVMSYLYDTLGLPEQVKVEGGKRTDKRTADAEAVERLLMVAPDRRTRKILQALLRCRHYPKFVATYLETLDEIHPSYAPATKDDSPGKRFSVSAATGRIIAKGQKAWKGTPGTPPIQQLPKPVRRMVVPPRGHLFLAGDYDSQELRLIAWVSGDASLKAAIEQGDIHAKNAAALRCDRTRAKNAFYGWAYGASARALVRAFASAGFHLKVEEAAAMLARLSSLYPGVPRWHREVFNLARSQGYLANGWGRRRYFHDPDAAFNEIVNFGIQSSGAEMGWDILLPLDALAAEYDGHLAILVHDEFVISVPKRAVVEVAPKFKAIMEQEFPNVSPGFRCPISLKVGASWGTMKAVEG